MKEFFLKGCGLQSVAKKQTYSQIFSRSRLKLSKLEQAFGGLLLLLDKSNRYYKRRIKQNAIFDFNQ